MVSALVSHMNVTGLVAPMSLSSRNEYLAPSEAGEEKAAKCGADCITP